MPVKRFDPLFRETRVGKRRGLRDRFTGAKVGVDREDRFKNYGGKIVHSTGEI